MHVRMSRVVVVDRHPLEVRAELVLERVHQASRVLAEVEASAVLGRDDELPESLVPGLLPRVELRCDPDSVLVLAVEAHAALVLPLGAFSREVAPMRAPVTPAARRDVAHLDGAALEARRRGQRGQDEGATARSRSPEAAQTRAHSREPTSAWTGASLHGTARTKGHAQVAVVARLHASSSELGALQPPPSSRSPHRETAAARACRRCRNGLHPTQSSVISPVRKNPARSARRGSAIPSTLRPLYLALHVRCAIENPGRRGSRAATAPIYRLAAHASTRDRGSEPRTRPVAPRLPALRGWRLRGSRASCRAGCTRLAMIACSSPGRRS